jgi:hypothetical protein
MNERSQKSRPRNIYQIANDLCELYQQQIDTLQGGTLAGLSKAESAQYSERQRKIRELQAALKKSKPRPS